MANDKEKLRVLKAHPELALNKEKLSQKLTRLSRVEQKGAGLTSLSVTQQSEFDRLNQQYQKKFKHPFIISVKGKTKAQILRQFKTRFENNNAEEFIAACKEVEKIAYFRLKELF